MSAVDQLRRKPENTQKNAKKQPTENQKNTKTVMEAKAK